MKKIAIKIFLFIVVIFIADRSIGSILEYLFKNEPQGDSSISTYAINKSTADVLIFGSSRASRHYKSSVLEEKLKMNCFNAGRDAMNILYSSSILPVIIKRHKPRLILLDINFNELSWKKGKEGEDVLISILKPYMEDHKEIEKDISSIDKLEVWKCRLSKLYTYNSLIGSLIQHHLNIGQVNESGYKPLFGTLDSLSTPNSKTRFVDPDPDLSRRFEDFIKVAKANKIEIYAVISPIKELPSESNMPAIKAILKRNKVQLIDFSSVPEINSRKYFRDHDHLNNIGSELFSRIISDEIIKVRAQARSKNKVNHNPPVAGKVQDGTSAL